MHLTGLRKYTPLLIVTAFSLAIKAYDPIRSPVLAALDPWGWTELTRRFLVTRELDPFFTQSGYPPTFMFLIAAIASLGIDPYDVVRYIPVGTALNIIPTYFLMLEIFRSHRISALASALAVTSRYYFMRTSIGIPEGLAHFFFVFMLLFLLRAIRTGKWIYKATAAILLATVVLYYHFTLVILAPFFAILPFTIGLPKRETVKVLATLSVPAVLMSGAAWYFRVLPDIVRFYFGFKIYTYQTPAFERSFAGYLYVLVYSIGKSAAVALAELGYVMILLAFAGLVSIMLLRRRGKKSELGINFLMTYLIVLGFMAIALRTVYNLGVAGAGDSSVYVFSWLSMPAAAFASHAALRVSDRLGHSLFGTFQTVTKGISDKQISKIVTMSLIVVLLLANLSVLNYYKASTGGGLGIMESHYYYKPLTDEEYYALRFVRYNTPQDAILMVVGVEEPMLTHYASVAQRTIVSIRNITTAAQSVILNAVVVFPDLHHLNLTTLYMKLNPADQQSIYVLIGVRKVNLQIARTNGIPPASTASLEKFLVGSISSLTGYDQLYQNDQVAVLQVFSTHVYY